ncbi:MAG: uracil-DNA glycosylase family protein [Balneolaceae bacterium]|nr:uracil-DNA glycosylase family protein [Balneolaceae bacterium]MBO6546967.1 uracil-DNA glycosylase family protein [Balneolaceae bacterium]MBO6649327.1 uracil-DNA glycosylase family protein [Balneolaceae bacterium]
MKELLLEIKDCSVCEEFLPLGTRPVVAASETSKILIIGQAPGSKVHETEIPWDDPSGGRLREWMGIDKNTFYDESLIALIPMGFCYPGRGKSGDLPPRPECAPLWHKSLLDFMPEIQLTLLFGTYAQSYYLNDRKKKTLTETVRNYEEYLPDYLPMPHPSPRNNIWLKKNPWFENELLPILKSQISALL